MSQLDLLERLNSISGQHRNAVLLTFLGTVLATRSGKPEEEDGECEILGEVDGFDVDNALGAEDGDGNNDDDDLGYAEL